MLDYTAGISTLVKECGFGRVQAAVEAARTRCKFLPEPAELRELLDVTPAVVIKPREPDPDCCACGGSGCSTRLPLWRLSTFKVEILC
jgi:hypothetical protein